MLDDIVGIIFLLLTGVVALVVGIILIKEYMAKKSLTHLFWGISYIVLFVSGVLIILFGFDVLGEAYIPPVAALIPVGMAVGLFFAKFEDKPIFGWGFLGYELIMIVVTLVVRLGQEVPDTPGLIMAIHVPGGLAIVLLPLLTGENKAWLISIGGALISFGGILLAFLKLADPFLGIFDAPTIYAILPPLLLIVGAFFTLGMIYPEKWRIQVPMLTEKLV